MQTCHKFRIKVMIPYANSPNWNVSMFMCFRVLMTIKSKNVKCSTLFRSSGLPSPKFKHRGPSSQLLRSANLGFWFLEANNRTANAPQRSRSTTSRQIHLKLCLSKCRKRNLGSLHVAPNQRYTFVVVTVEEVPKPVFWKDSIVWI